MPKAWRRLFLATAGVVTLAVPVVVILPAASRPRAQSASPTADRLAFEVASIKPNKSSDRIMAPMLQPSGRYTGTNVPLGLLIALAYRPNQRIEEVGWPDWVNTERFDIEAKAPETNPTPEQISLMLQSLLADRFKLVVHHEIQQRPVYAVVLVKPGQRGPQLIPHMDDTKCIAPPVPLPQPPEVTRGAPGMTTPLCGGFIAGPGHQAGQKITMEQFARSISGFDGRVVLDRTGSSAELMTLRFQFLRLLLPHHRVHSLGLPRVRLTH